MADFPAVGVTATVQGINSFLRDMGKMQSGIDTTADSADKAGGRIGRVGGKIAGIGKAAAVAAATGVAALGAAVVGVGVASLKTAIDFEAAWSGVVKTTDGLVDEFGNLTEAGAEMQQGFRDLSKEVPIAVEELLEIGELGGQLGVASDDLLDFTETIAAMGVSTNLTTEAAATDLAQLGNIMGTTARLGGEGFERLGSTIVALGNNSATTEAEISSFAQRVAGAAAVAGVTEADVLGISAAFSSVGIQAQAGGTAVSKVFLQMNKAALEGGDQMEIFAAVAGLNAEDFASSWQNNAGPVFAQFVKGLGMAGDDAITILDELGIKDSQAVRAFLSLAGAGDLVTNSLAIANDGWHSNVALAEEAAKKYATTESQIAILKNTIKDVAITIGNFLLPAFNKLLQVATSMVAKLGKNVAGFFTSVLIPAIEKISSAFSKLVTQIKGFGITALWSSFEDGSSILSEFFVNIGLGEGMAKKLAGILQSVIKTVLDLYRAFKFALSGDIAGVLESVWNAMHFGLGVSEDVADTVTDAIENIIKEIKSLARDAAKFISGTLIPAFEQVGQFILTQVVPALIEFIGAVVSFVQQHGPAIRNALLAIGAVLAGAQIVASIIGVVAAITALFNPITLIVAAVALLAAAWTENWFGIRDVVAQALEFIIPIFQSLVEFVTSTLIPAFVEFGEYLSTILQPIIAAITAHIVEKFNEVKAWVSENWPLIQETIQAVITAIQDGIQTALSGISAFWQENGATIIATIMQHWTFIKSFIDAQLALIIGFIKAAMEAINGDWDAAWATVKEAVANAWELIKTGLDAELEVIKTIVGAALDVLEHIFSTAWQNIQDAVDNAITWIKQKVNSGLKGIRDIVDFILNSIKDKATEIWDSIANVFQSGIDKAKGFVTGAVDAFKSAGGAIVNALKEGISAAWDDLVGFVQDGLDRLTDLLPGSEPKDTRSPLRDLAGRGAAIVNNITEGIQAAIPAMQAQLSAAFAPSQQAAPVTTIGGNVTNTTNITRVEVAPVLRSEPSEMSMFNDVTAALVAART